MVNTIGSGEAQIVARGSPFDSRPPHLDPVITRHDDGGMVYLKEEGYI
jgi:hypothetical protein